MPGECIATARFAAYLSGHLDDAEVAATERHLDACAACRAVLVGAARAQRSRSGPTAAEDGAVPGRLGRFEVRRVLGAGGMGVVYEAYDAELARRVAIKVMRPELPASALARTRIEALALARLSHPNVVQLYELGVHEGRTYLVTELVEGEGLRAWMARRRSEGEVLGVFAQAGAGLAAAHAVGLVHRDFKPDNVIVGADGRVRVLDFGLARDELRADPAATSVSWATASGAAEPPTEAGAVMGTPAYMAPEQRLGAPADSRSDQYSFCVALFEALHGERPAGLDALTTTSVGADASSRRRARTRVEAVLRRGLAVEPAERFPDMPTLLAALAPAPRRAWAGWFVAGSAAALAAALFVRGAGGSSRCAAETAEAAAAWRPADRDELRRAMFAAGAPSAATVWRQVEAAFDEFVREWGEVRREACVDGDDAAGPRERCLQAALDGFRGLRDALGAADRGGVERAPEALRSLVDPRRCAADVPVRSLFAAAEGDPAARLHERQLSRARSLNGLGMHGPARALAEAVLRARGGGGADGLRAEAYLVRGVAETGAGDASAAESSLRAALREAAEAGDDRALADTWAQMVYTLGELGGRLDLALTLDEVAQTAILRAGDDPTLRARLGLKAIGILLRKGRPEDALARAGRVADDLAALPRPDPLYLAVLANHRGAAHALRGANQEALAHYEEALARYQDVFGEDHPRVAAVLVNLGGTLVAERRYEEALAVHLRALGRLRALHGVRHPRVATALHNVSITSMHMGAWMSARAYAHEALTVAEAVMPPDHVSVALYREQMATVARHFGDAPTAARLLRRVVDVRARQLGPDHADTRSAREALAELADVPVASTSR